MRSLIFIALAIFLPVLSVAQELLQEKDFTENELVVYKMSIKSSTEREALNQLDKSLNKRADFYLVVVHRNKMKCFIIAKKGISTEDFEQAFSSHHVDVSYDKREWLNKDVFLKVYAGELSQNSQPRFINTDTPEKDRHYFELAQKIWKEKFE